MIQINIGLIFYLVCCLLAYAIMMAAIKRFDELKDVIEPFEPKFICTIGALFSWLAVAYFTWGFIVDIYYQIKDKQD